MVDFIINAAFWIAVIYGALSLTGILSALPQRQAKKHADIRALNLLRRHLTPKQRQTFEDWDYFDVVGNYTGRTYRILWYEDGFNYTIVRLSQDLRRPAGEFCLTLDVPSMPRGDVVLAQKFAIETREADFLETANYDEICSWPYDEVFPDGQPISSSQTPVASARWASTSWTVSGSTATSGGASPSRWQPVAFTTRRGNA